MGNDPDLEQCDLAVLRDRPNVDAIGLVLVPRRPNAFALAPNFNRIAHDSGVVSWRKAFQLAQSLAVITAQLLADVLLDHDGAMLLGNSYHQMESRGIYIWRHGKNSVLADLQVVFASDQKHTGRNFRLIKLTQLRCLHQTPPSG